MSLNLATIAEWLALPPVSAIEITGVSIDTRTLKPGNLFVAFPGEQVDGHAFIHDAILRGAAAILCRTPQPDLNVPVLCYPDPQQALTVMAAAHRKTISCPVVALTGSNGKTSVKEMLASILPPQTFKTPGNWNNHLGVPLSILQLEPFHQYAVFELGANHLGEISHTVNIVKPDVALINNVGTAHLEGFGSVDNIARAKGEIYQGLSDMGCAVVNADDVYAPFWIASLPNKRVFRFSSQANTADLYATDMGMSAAGRATFQLHLGDLSADITLTVPGRHQVQNALAAASVATVLGVDMASIAAGLNTFAGFPGRLTPKKSTTGALIFDDTYNANLNSVLAAIDLLALYPGRRILVLGDMAELGQHAKSHHEAVGKAAREQGIEYLITCGQQSEAAATVFGEHAQHFLTHTALIAALKPMLDANTTVLVKGSRASAMEQVVSGIV